MQLTDVICFALFTVSVTATCLQSQNSEPRLVKKIAERRISKRDTAILLDNFPQESVKEKIARVYVKKKSSRGRNARLRYGSRSKGNRKPYANRKPSGKYQKPKLLTSKIPPSNKKIPSLKPRRRLPNLKATKTLIKQHATGDSLMFRRPEPMGFGEPPSAHISDISPKETYGEPPLDSYGSPLQTHLPFPYLRNPYDNNNEYLNQDYENWMSNNDNIQYDKDNDYAHSIKQASNLKPDAFIDERLKSHNYFMNEIRTKGSFPYLVKKKKYSKHFNDLPGWAFGSTNGSEDAESQVLVGGQYAEPPARYVANFRPSAPMYMGDGEFSPLNGVVDSSISTISPYVNYKNSNIAFSPQNLNDAFSIID